MTLPSEGTDTAVYRGTPRRVGGCSGALDPQRLRRATRTDLTALLPDVVPRGGPDECPYVDPHYWAAFAYTGA